MPELGQNIGHSSFVAEQARQRDLFDHIINYAEGLIVAHLAGDKEAISVLTDRIDEVNAQLVESDPTYVVKLGRHCNVRRN